MTIIIDGGKYGNYRGTLPPRVQLEAQTRDDAQELNRQARENAKEIERGSEPFSFSDIFFDAVKTIFNLHPPDSPQPAGNTQKRGFQGSTRITG